MDLFALLAREFKSSDDLGGIERKWQAFLTDQLIKPAHLVD